MSIPAGQRVGLVGPSGAGKSTLVSLVQRVEDVQGGQVVIDGQPLTAVTQDSLRTAIAVVPQEITLFHRPILENIRYGRPDASDEDVVAAARAACCDEFINGLPEGYATMVGERGMKLSGGQRQRIGIARAILKDAPILVLDEATSALDSHSEAAVQRALATLVQGRTVLAIAHRLSTLASLDRIVVLVDGRIIEDGSPAGLRHAGGMFDAMWRLQADNMALREGDRQCGLSVPAPAGTWTSNTRHHECSDGTLRLGRHRPHLAHRHPGPGAEELDPTVHIEYVLDADRLRPFNIDATMRMGYRPRLLPSRTSESRGPIVRACFSDADVIVDDVARYLLPLRHHVPRAAWVSIAMHPVGDELFMDWPLMAHMDGIIWAYPPAVGLPPELDIVADKVVQTGPFLDLDGVPEKAAARARLGFADDEQIVVYAPRGFPFGEEFGQPMLAGLFSAVEGLRGARFPKLRLVLLAVDDPAQLRRVGGMPAELPGWVTVLGVVTPPEALVFAQAADILIGEGTSTIHEGAALRTPLVVVPGPIQEILRLAKALKDRASGPCARHRARSLPIPWPTRSIRFWASPTGATR